MRKYELNYTVLLIGFMFIFTSEANTSAIDKLDSIKEKIDRAILKFEQTNKKDWSYTVSRYENEEGDITSSIEQYSPKSGEKWLLKEIDGQLPTKKQIRKFSEKKKLKRTTDKKNDKQDSDITISLREMVNPKSLSLVKMDDKQITMAFNVNWKKLGEDSVGKLQGQLTYQKKLQFIDKISIWNNTEFSPVFTANITNLMVTFNFIHINNAVLIKSNEMKMKGSFAYFTEIDETSLDSYSKYIYQGN